MAFTTQTFAFGSLLTSAKMTAMQDNDTYLYGVVHPPITAGDFLIHPGAILGVGSGTSATVSWKTYSTVATGYTKVAEKGVPVSGTLRITFGFRLSAGVGTGYAKIYRNGSPVGTERTSGSQNWTTFSEDISGWSEGDLLQVYCYHSTGAYSAILAAIQIKQADAVESILYWAEGI